MDPGPEDPSVLTLQADHRSTDIWNGEECGPLACRTHMRAPFDLDPFVANYISGTQFDGISRLGYVPLNSDLITALVERWREETHTFHLPFGEVTITLQDVNVLFGLKVGGRAVTGSDNYDFAEMLEEYLGLRPPPNILKGSKLKLTWLRENFQVLPRDENGDFNGENLQRCVRAYLFYLIGTVLFPDKTGNTVQMIYFPLLIDLEKLDEISWGSGVLAYLYRNLCKASKRGVLGISGALLLVQLWSWERILFSRPTILRPMMPTVPQRRVEPLGCKWLRVERTYNDGRMTLVVLRDLFDRMSESQFTWVPYTPDVLECLSPICYEDEEEWIVIAPLICFEMVEWHLPNRCVRQFGWHQDVPEFCNTSVDLHDTSRREGRRDYGDVHELYVNAWNHRKSKMVMPGRVYSGYMHYNDEYMQWYRSITRLIISPLSASTNRDYEQHHCYYPTAADHETLIRMGVYNYNKSTALLQHMPDDVPLAFANNIRGMQMMSLQALQNTRQGHHVQQEEERVHTPPRYNFRHLEQREQVSPAQNIEREEAGPSRSRKTRRRRTDN